MLNRSFEINGDAVGTEGSATAEQITGTKPEDGVEKRKVQDTYSPPKGESFNGVSD